MNKLPILMTASISTRGMKGADFSAAEREVMYLSALEYYIESILKQELDRKIVFAENSGWNLERLKSHVADLSKGQVEFISLDVNDFDVSKGKGYNETILINQAIEKSKAIKFAGAFLKVTGRYPIFNLGYFLRTADEFIANGGQFYGDMKDHIVYDVLFPYNTAKWNGHAAYTVLFASTISFWNERLAGLYRRINDYTGDWIECVWYRELINYRWNKDKRINLRFKREPICGGLQGSTGETIAFSKDNTALKSKIARLIGNCIRIFMPWFWF